MSAIDKSHDAAGDQPSDVSVRNVAIATDFSPWSDRATQHALAVVQQFGAVVHFLHTVRRSEFALTPDLMVQLNEVAQRDCDDLICRLNAAHSLDGIEYRCWNLEGEVDEVFEEFVQKHRIDLLVLGTRGRSGVRKLFLGSTAQEILRSVSCPLLSVGPLSRGATRRLFINRVLLVADLSTLALDATPYVQAVARTWHAQIDVLLLCSKQNSDCQSLMDDFSRSMNALAGTEASCSIRYHTLPGKSPQAVLNFLRENQEDLIVLGMDPSGSHNSGPSLSHAYEIVRQATCPVLILRDAAVPVSAAVQPGIGHADRTKGSTPKSIRFGQAH